MCTAGQRVLLTVTGTGPSFFYTKIYAGQQPQRGRCPIEHGEEFLSVRLCGKIDPCALEERVKGLRALWVRVPGPGWALARDGWMFVRSLARSDGRKFSPVF